MAERNRPALRTGGRGGLVFSGAPCRAMRQGAPFPVGGLPSSPTGLVLGLCVRWTGGGHVRLPSRHFTHAWPVFAGSGKRFHIASTGSSTTLVHLCTRYYRVVQDKKSDRSPAFEGGRGDGALSRCCCLHVRMDVRLHCQAGSGRAREVPAGWQTPPAA